MADIVIVDDEDALREPVAAYLVDQGLAVADVASGAALDRLIARDGIPRLVILDVTMPSEDGFSILRRLREAVGDAIGVILLTARRDVIDRVVGLELGADDYIMKPFEPRELLARVRTVLRRLDAKSTGRERDPATPAPKLDDDPFWVSTPQGHISVPISSIDWIEAARDYALLHTGARSHMIRVTMTDLEARLDSALMIRVHRSAFVRPAAVRAMSRSGGHVSVILMSGRTIRVGPAYVREVRARLSTTAPD